MGIGKFLKKAIKVIAIVAVVVAVAWVAAPYLGAFGAAIQTGITAVGEAIAAGAAAIGDALGLTATAANAGGAAAAAEGMGVGAAAGEAAGSFTGSALAADAGAAAASGATLGTEAAAANIAAEGAAANAAQSVLGAQTPGMLGTTGAADAFALSDATAGMVGNAAAPAVTNTGGMLSQAGAWVKDNPLVASTLLKGAGDFAGSLAGNEAEDKMRAQMEFEDWQRQRLSDSVIGGLQGSNLQYNAKAAPRVLRRTDGTPVYTNTGGTPGGALQRVMPGYGG